MDLKNFHVITVISNPNQYGSRYKLYDIFSEDIIRKGATLWTVEMATGAMLHKVTDIQDEKHIQVWASALPGELWHKENMINIGIHHISRTDPNWRYVAWVDADVKFEPGMLEKTVERLQKWHVVQMWSHAIDLGPSQETLQVQLGYMYAYWKGIQINSQTGYTMGGHPGYAWAARRETMNNLGMLVDWGALGSADRHMAGALVQKVHETYHGDIHPTYKRWLHNWQERSGIYVKENAGYVDGTIRHMWHGKKTDRGYSSRWKILIENQFNPETDLKRDVFGLWQLCSETERQRKLRDDMRKYFFARKEDSIDLL